ncbi:MAG TPA: DNA mismatch repair protein MutS [Chitinophagaceae bacterium]|nr:DNA mismatch repair protein MutS [Chitinophagaceae bacterium]
MPVSTYTSLLNGYADKAQTLRRQLGWLSLLRLLLFIGFIFCGYKAIATGHATFILSAIALLIIFLLLIRLYDKWQQDTAFYKALVQLNRDEIDFLQGKPSVYADGREYTDPHHPYSYDLDLFGDGGLYSYLNRCSTGFGKEALAQSLLSPKTGDIAARQQAIAELKDKLRFRQHLQAHGSLLHTKEKEMRQLRAWLQAPSSFNNATLYKLLFLFPLASTAALIAYIITEQDNLLNAFYYLFILNLVVAFSFSRKITAHLSVSASVTKILQQFSGQLKQIEAEKFQSPLLLQYQQALQSGLLTASRSIARLASLFNYLETIVNLVVSMLLNGLFLFHVHILYALEKWKQQNGRLILPWLQVLGEMEALNSFANLAYNNPSFCTPALSPAPTLEAARMGHLLIRPEKRINNSISFSQQRFVILTGSNMSGKSTFLRTLGTSLVLARTGSVVCAERFVFYPFSVHVSMRITDSLQDSESFFYAELKRLRAIIEEIESGEQTFVILDEILRGTNSNDKHNGTVGLVQKLVAAKACGIIATHDLTVSALKEQRPDYISNKCFESEIINDELIFDYRLKDGVCEKLSASFLMKKMGIIS